MGNMFEKTEKNATGWSNEKLKSLLEGVVVEDESYFCEIKELSTCTGEASASNRKAKLIFFYEWDLKGEWKGNKKGSSTSFTGKFDIPNLSDEYDSSEIDVNFTITSDKDEAYKVKEFMRKAGQEKVREQLATYIKQLKEEYSQGMVLPNKNATEDTVQLNQVPNVNSVRREMAKTVINSKDKSFGVKIKCKKLTSTEEFKCTASDLYQALTELDRVRAFTRGNVQQFEAGKGERFVLFDGNIQGEFTRLVRDECICMRWRNKSWPAEHYSDVTLTFDEKDDCTRLTLSQTGVPENEYERTREGWARYYWDSMKQTFGFGTRLY